MADIRAQHIKTGEIKNLPEKVFKQVQHKYKFLSYVDDPNVQPPQPLTNVAAQDVVDNMAGVAKVSMVEQEAFEAPEETIEELRLRYAAVTGKKPGNKSKLTLQKELNNN